MGLLRALLVVLCLTPCFAAISYNTGSSCTAAIGGCMWTNQSIWIGDKVPSVGDEVIISSTDEVIIHINTSVQVASLIIRGAAVQLVTSNNLVAENVSVEEGATLNVKAETVSYGTSGNGTNATTTIAVDAQSKLSVATNAHLQWNSAGLSSFLGTITLSTGSTFFVNQATWAPTQTSSLGVVPSFSAVFVPVGATVIFPGLNATHLTAQLNSSVTVNGGFTGALSAYGNVTFASGNINLVNPTTVESFVTFSGVNVTVGFGGMETFNGNIVLTGTVLAAFENLTITNLDVLNTATAVTITGNNFVLVNATNWGTLTLAAVNQGITVQGHVMATKLISTSSQVTVPSGASLSVGSVEFYSSQMNLGGVLDVTSRAMVLPVGSTLSTTGAALIFGNFDNQGTVIISTEETLEILNGNYSQTGNATLKVTLHAQGTPALIVANESIVLSGNVTLQYSITDQPYFKSANFQLAAAGQKYVPTGNNTHNVSTPAPTQAPNTTNGTTPVSNSHVYGTFASDATSFGDSKITRSLSIKYTTDSIYIEYDFRLSDIPAWMWVVLGVAVAVILIATIAIIVKCRRRSGYEPVH